MTYKKLIVTAAILLWLPLHLYAAELKIGVVNAAKVLEDAPQADAARKKLEGEFATRDKKIIQFQKKLRNLEERLERDGTIMSESERRKVERDIISLKRDIRRGKEEFRDDLNIRRNEEFAKLQKRVSQSILSIAREGNYDLILTDGVIFASDKVDITDRVLKQLQKQYRLPSESKKPTKKNTNR